ncbi:MAG: type II toxin-antitoxin system RelE/ParE family toxin [Xenococcaceae cyanobacterium]
MPQVSKSPSPHAFFRSPPLVKVEASRIFKKNIKTLGKKYRSIRQDVEPIIKQLQSGELPGDKISGIGYKVFKLRVRNSDSIKGKSGSYRLIYYCQTATGIILLTIYSKSEQVDITADDIKRIILQSES